MFCLFLVSSILLCKKEKPLWSINDFLKPWNILHLCSFIDSFSANRKK